MEFIHEFKYGKKYYFDKDTYMKYHKNYELGICRTWVGYCDKKIVQIIDNVNGKIGFYSIVPEWCKEVVENER